MAASHSRQPNDRSHAIADFQVLLLPVGLWSATIRAAETSVSEALQLKTARGHAAVSVLELACLRQVRPNTRHLIILMAF